MRDDESERKVYDDRSFPRVYFSFTVLSPVRCAISKHKYRFIMEMRTNLTREKSNTFPSLLIKFLLVINVYFSIFLARWKHWESSIKESGKKFPSKGGNLPSVYVKMIIISVTQGCDREKKVSWDCVTSSVSNSVSKGEAKNSFAFQKVQKVNLE
jgi:hypothetical protein